MDNQQTKPDDENTEKTSGQQNFQVHVSPELDYSYRDVFNVFVGTGDVVFEFGNQHRSMPEHITISNRIVLSVPSAYSFVNQLQQALHAAQVQLQQAMAQQQGQSPEKQQPDEGTPNTP